MKAHRQLTSVMLACNDEWDHSHLVGDYVIQNKIDGIRAWGSDDGCGGTLLATRKPGKYIHNIHTRRKFNHKSYRNLDGELVIPGYSFHDSSGIIRSHDDPRGADAVWMIFDSLSHPTLSYAERHIKLQAIGNLAGIHIMAAPLYTANNPELYLACLEAEMAKYNLPFEGYILRQLDSRYKIGRATRKEASLFKLVADTRGVAQFRRFIPRLSQESSIPLAEVGAIECNYNGVTLRVSGNFSRAKAEYWWRNRAEIQPETEIHFRYKHEGTLFLPRQAVYISGLP